MGLFRVVMEVTTDDIGSLTRLFAEGAESLEEHLPGTLAREKFVDEASGRALIYEVDQNEDATELCEAHMASAGFMATAFELLTSAKVTILNPVQQAAWTEIAERPTSVILSRSAGFSRYIVISSRPHAPIWAGVHDSKCRGSFAQARSTAPDWAIWGPRRS